MTISVVIPTKNAGPEFREVVKQIRNQDCSSVELIVIDSGSVDETVDIAREWADTVIEIAPDEFHHGQTRNRGANAASNDLIVFTVQDAKPADDQWLANLTEPIATGDADVTYGNQIAYPDAKPPDQFFYRYFYPDDPVRLTTEDTTDTAAFYLDNIFLSDVNAAVSREVWNEFQFRDSVGMSEDKDFAYRVASAGYSIQYCPDAQVYHSHDYTFRSLFARRYKDGKAFAELVTDGSGDFVSEGLRYIRAEYSFLLRSGALPWIPYTFVYDLIYFISFTLGKNHQWVPTPIDRRLSRPDR